MENLHYQPEYETCLKTKILFENWKNNNWISSDYISIEDVLEIRNQIDIIDFYDSQSKLWKEEDVKNAFVFIKKKWDV